MYNNVRIMVTKLYAWYLFRVNRLLVSILYRITFLARNLHFARDFAVYVAQINEQVYNYCTSEIYKRYMTVHV